MVGQFFKSLGLAIPMAIIGAIYFALGYAMLSVIKDTWAAIIVLFFINMFITFIFTKINSALWRGMNFMYHFWVLAVVVGMYLYFYYNQLKLEDSWSYYIVGEFTILFFIVPECTSGWTSYLVTTYINDVEVDSYISKEYTSGTLVKLGFMALGTALFSLAIVFFHTTGFFIVFGGHCLYLLVMFLIGLKGFIDDR